MSFLRIFAVHLWFSLASYFSHVLWIFREMTGQSESWINLLNGLFLFLYTPFYFNLPSDGFRDIEIKNIVTIARGEWGGDSGERGL